MDKKFNEWFNSKSQEGLSFTEMLYQAYQFGKESRRKPKNDPHPAYSFCVELWLKEIHPLWKFNGAEGKALNELIAQMEKYFNASHDRLPTVQETVNFFKHFCLKLPNFYKTKNLKILNQNFDGIIAEIRTQGKPTPKNSAQQQFSKFAGR